MLPSDKEQQEINELAQQFERATGAQAVAAVVGKADAYPDIPWKAFALGAGLAALAVVLDALLRPGWAGIHTPVRDVLAILAAGVSCALAAACLPRFARLFLHRGRAAAEVRQHAQGLFLQRELIETDSASSGFQQPDLSLTERLLFGAFIFGIIGFLCGCGCGRGCRCRFQAGFFSFDKNCLRNFATLGATTATQ